MDEKNLLIIDDEQDLLLNLRTLLKKYASCIFTASNGFAGLEILQKETIHCVICDISMPGMSGLEVIKKVRSTGNEVPFIFYTAFGNHELMMEAVKYGAFDFLSKPIFEDLEAVVSRGLSEGFKGSQQEPENARANEYQKILDEFLRKIRDTE